MSLELRGVQKTYRDPEGRPFKVLNIEHFAMAQGEQAALVGTSGGGKTTLLNAIAGITSVDQGSIVISGTNIASMIEPVRDRFRSERIGYVFQTFNLLPAFSAIENVMLGMSFSSQKPSRDRARDLLARVGLGDRLNHRPYQLSVGQQQRVSVVRALAKVPKLLLADEPTANVDGPNQESVMNLIREMCTENNVTLLVVTHTQEVASKFPRVESLAGFNRQEAA